MIMPRDVGDIQIDDCFLYLCFGALRMIRDVIGRNLFQQLQPQGWDMSIENRFYLRYPTQAVVQIGRRGHLVRSTNLVEVSAGGVAINNCGLDLNSGIVVEVRVLGAVAEFDLTEIFRALVVHASSNTAGLMFVGSGIRQSGPDAIALVARQIN